MNQTDFQKAVEYLSKELSPNLIAHLQSTGINHEVGPMVRDILKRSDTGLEYHWFEVLKEVIRLHGKGEKTASTGSRIKFGVPPVTGEPETLQWLLRRGQVQIEHFASGETIFPENESGGKMYIVKEGEVEVLFRGKILGVLRQGDIVGETEVDDNPPSPGSYAKTDCELIVWDQDQLFSLFSERPDIGLSVVMRLMARLNWRRLAGRAMIGDDRDIGSHPWPPQYPEPGPTLLDLEREIKETTERAQRAEQAFEQAREKCQGTEKGATVEYRQARREWLELKLGLKVLHAIRKARNT